MGDDAGALFLQGGQYLACGAGGYGIGAVLGRQNAGLALNEDEVRKERPYSVGPLIVRGDLP